MYLVLIFNLFVLQLKNEFEFLFFYFSILIKIWFKLLQLFSRKISNYELEILTAIWILYSTYIQNVYIFQFIKARIIHIGPLRAYTGGKCFSMSLIDSTGEIKCTAFDTAVDRFHNKLTVNLNLKKYVSQITFTLDIFISNRYIHSIFVIGW